MTKQQKKAQKKRQKQAQQNRMKLVDGWALRQAEERAEIIGDIPIMILPEDREDAEKNVPKVRKPKPGVVALREIRNVQKSGAHLLQKKPFRRFVREQWATKLMFKPTALDAIQEAAEAYAVNLLEGAVLLQLHRKRKTLVKKDINYCRRIKENDFDA